MLLTTIILIISILIIKRNNYFNLFIQGYILGIVLTQFDYIFKLLNNIPYEYLNIDLYNKFSHSIVTIFLIFITLLIVSEHKKNHTIKIIANGIIFGYIAHVIFDIIFSFIPITIFWPLPINEIHLFNIKFPNSYHLITSIIGLVLTRYFLWALNECIVMRSNHDFPIIKTIFKWMKNQIYFLILIIIFYFIQFNYYIIIYDFITIINLFMITYIIYNSSSLFNRENQHG